MDSASPTILAIETSSPWVVMLAVSVVTFPLVLLVRRVISRPGGLASGLLLALPLVLPLLAAAAFAAAVFPEVAVLRPALLKDEGRCLLQFVMLSDGRTQMLVPYSMCGSPGPWIVLIGVSASSLLLLRRLLGALSMRRFLRKCRPLEGDDARLVEALVRKICLAAGRGSVPGVLLQPGGCSGAFATYGKGGKIVLSEDLVSALDRDEIEAVLAHEIAHLQARDVPLVFMAGLLRDMAAWNPVAHVAFRCLARDREFEADRSAAALTGKPLAVASSLLKLYDLTSRRNRARRRPALAFLHVRGSVSRRVQRLLALADARDSVASVGPAPFVLAACLVALLGFHAAANIARQDHPALALIWGAPEMSSIERWRPGPPRNSGGRRDASRPAPAARRAARDVSETLLERSYGLREKDVPRWAKSMAKLAKLHGLNAPSLPLDVRDGWWTAKPVFAESGPLMVYRIERLR